MVAALPPAKVELPPVRHPRWGRRVLIGAGVVALAVGGAQAVRVLRRPPAITIVAVLREDVTRVLAVTGRVEAERTVTVAPQLSGRLTATEHREGDRVNAGDVLARLEDPAATATVVQQRATLAARRRDLAPATRDLVRTEHLVAAGAVAIRELEIARLTAAQARSDVARLTAALASGKAQLVLVAPFAGTITRRDGEVGQLVSASSAVFELAAVDPQTGAATVRLAYVTVPPGLLVGMSVDINIDVAAIAGAVTVPRAAVGGVGRTAFALVVVGDRVERRALEVDDWPAASVVVRAGLQAGERIATDPTAARAGTRVRPQLREAVPVDAL